MDPTCHVYTIRVIKGTPRENSLSYEKRRKLKGSANIQGENCLKAEDARTHIPAKSFLPCA